MSDEKLWIAVGSEEREPTENVLREVRDAIEDKFDREIIVTAKTVDTISADEAAEIAESLIDALESGPDD